MNLLPNIDLAKFIPKTTSKGSPPGTVTYVGKLRRKKVAVNIIDYNLKEVVRKKITNLDELKKLKNRKTTTWIDVSGVHDAGIVKTIGDIFDIHPLIQEDITNTTHRPKIEEYDDCIFLILKMAYNDPKTDALLIEQVSIILGAGYLITFQENSYDIFTPLRERIMNPKSQIRSKGADYLAYRMTDSIVDNYFNVLEFIGGQIEDIEEELIGRSVHEKTQGAIYRLKRRLIYLRKSIWPMREIINSLNRNDNKLLTKTTRLHLRDVYDHVLQASETVETFRDMTSGLMELYLSMVSNRMNEIMKVLTIFAAIFIPLTFIAGVYGMNFEYMPELSWRWGYFSVWGVIIVVGLGLLIAFKRKKWL